MPAEFILLIGAKVTGLKKRTERMLKIHIHFSWVRNLMPTVEKYNTHKEDW